MQFWSFIGVILVLFNLWKFLKEIGKSYPILELLLLIASLQWIIGPIISYRSNVKHYKYFMYVDEETYMSFVVPGLLFFTLIIFFITYKSNKIELNIQKKEIQYGKILFGIGIFSDIASVLAPASLKFIFFILSQFKFVGSGLLLFSDNKKDRYFFYGSIVYLVLISLRKAMFHDLILWSVLLFLIWAIKYKPTIKTKLLIMLSGILLLVIIQMTKATFREAIWSGGFQGNKFALFVDIFEEKLASGFLEDETSQNDLNVRLNQGWIISAIMYNTPNNEPYAEGDTISEAILASLLPRFLNPNKKQAGGQENFRKYTGLSLGDNTSMGLSIIGEGYANYGVFGGIIFMGCWGVFLSWYWRSIKKFMIKHPLLLFFVPLLFLQVIKAETELVVVLNHLLKSSIVVAFFFFYVKKHLRWKI